MLKCIKEIYRVNPDPPVHNRFKKCTQTGKTYDTQFRKTGSDSYPINRNVTRWPLLLPRSICLFLPTHIWVSEWKVSFCGQMGHFQPLAFVFSLSRVCFGLCRRKKPDAFKWTRNERLYEFHKNVCFSLQV